MATVRFDTEPNALDALALCIAEGVMAFQYTREYVGFETLPAIEGWSWYDWIVGAERTLRQYWNT